jgi:hypothetical protein
MLIELCHHSKAWGSILDLFSLKVALRAAKGAAKRFIYIVGTLDVFHAGERSSQDRLNSHSGLAINIFCSEETRFRRRPTR